MKLKLIAYTITPKLDQTEQFNNFKELTKNELNLIANSVNCKSIDFNLCQALLLSSKLAGICYMREDFEKILNESAENSFRRLNIVLKSGHHSVFDHFHITFELSNIPKILAMFLNNEKNYTTSEKSARYTKYGNLPGIEGELYNKWNEILAKVIKEIYPCLYNPKLKNPMSTIEKLAQENARYFVSIFSPLTTMAYTTSLRQWNYLIYMFKKYISTKSISKNNELNSFDKLLLPILEEFISLAEEYKIEGLIPINKERSLSLIGDLAYFNLPSYFSYSYQTSFYASYACFAQVQRHRNEHCFLFNNQREFIIPKILLNKKQLLEEWKNDGLKVIDTHPQGRIVKIIQTGNIDTFIMKYQERCCGSTQLETMLHQVDIANKFIKQSPYAYKILEITGGHTARCLFKNGSCNKKCMLGVNQYERLI